MKLLLAFTLGAASVIAGVFYIALLDAEWRVEQLEHALWHAANPVDDAEEFEFDMRDLFDE